MSKDDVLPELKEILGAMIFAASRPLTAKEIRQCLVEVAKTVGGDAAAFGEAKEADVRATLDELQKELELRKCGFLVTEVAGGFRFQSRPACGKWIRHLLKLGRTDRLSQPALETLAIIAYRQPIGKSEIEAVRGVNVDHIIKSLMEMQLVKIVGRSELPGRPFQYGTTQLFLEHFGLKNVKDLATIDPMLFREKEVAKPSAKQPGEPAIDEAVRTAGEAELEESDDEPATEKGDGKAKGRGRSKKAKAEEAAEEASTAKSEEKDSDEVNRGEAVNEKNEENDPANEDGEEQDLDARDRRGRKNEGKGGADEEDEDEFDDDDDDDDEDDEDDEDDDEDEDEDEEDERD